jgi:hypothetical protein
VAVAVLHERMIEVAQLAVSKQPAYFAVIKELTPHRITHLTSPITAFTLTVFFYCAHL